MLSLTKTDGSSIAVNPDMIEFIEKTPDTVITMNTGEKILVREPTEDVLDMILSYKKAASGGR